MNSGDIGFQKQGQYNCRTRFLNSNNLMLRGAVKCVEEFAVKTSDTGVAAWRLIPMRILINVKMAAAAPPPAPNRAGSLRSRARARQRVGPDLGHPGGLGHGGIASGLLLPWQLGLSTLSIRMQKTLQQSNANGLLNPSLNGWHYPPRYNWHAIEPTRPIRSTQTLTVAPFWERPSRRRAKARPRGGRCDLAREDSGGEPVADHVGEGGIWLRRPTRPSCQHSSCHHKHRGTRRHLHPVGRWLGRRGFSRGPGAAPEGEEAAARRRARTVLGRRTVAAKT